MKNKPKYRLQRKAQRHIRWQGMAWVTNSKSEALKEVEAIHNDKEPDVRVWSYVLRRPLTMGDVSCQK